MYTFLNSQVKKLKGTVSQDFFEKIRNGPDGTIRGLRELIHEKKQKQKISCHCPFKQTMNGSPWVVFGISVPESSLPSSIFTSFLNLSMSSLLAPLLWPLLLLL
jgi:hypothetical protein